MKTQEGRRTRKRRGEEGGREREESRTRRHRSYERGVKDERAMGKEEGGGEGEECGGPLLDVETPRRKKKKGEERREGEKEPRPR